MSSTISSKIGESIPPNTKHAVSVCLPTWEATVGYEEADPAVVDVMSTGYPRFFIHKSIARLCEVLSDKYAKESETCLCFPSYSVAKRCREFIAVKAPTVFSELPAPKVRILQLATTKPINAEEAKWKRECKIAVVFVAKEYYPLMKQYWQHTGEIISSRFAEYVLHELFIVERSSRTADVSREAGEDVGGTRSEEEFIETRFGRSLDLSFADQAKQLIKKRIATKVVEEGSSEDVAPQEHVVATESTVVETIEQSDTVASEIIDVQDIESDRRRGLEVNPDKDVFLFPSGMASIFTAHRLLLHYDSQRVSRSRFSSASGAAANTENHSPSPASYLVGYGPPYKKTVMFGFPYTDTLSILQKFNHTHFLGHGDSSSMEELKSILQSGEQILAVFMETPSNPLLKMGDLVELRRLADLYGFFIVVDETAGGFVNIDVLPHADIVCSSLTKIFSGDSNVIAGSMVLNPQSKLYRFAQTFLLANGEYEDHLWCEDALALERNSRDFVQRTIKINRNTECLLQNVLIPQSGKLFKKIFYPSLTSRETKLHYDAVRCKADGGYGGLFSLTFYRLEQARAFFDALHLCKGPSLGTNFTLACPYAILAHYRELDQVARYGVERSLVRVSVGLENKNYLCQVFQDAIDKALLA
ncbi:hypothetical protein HG536_0C06180 [Torulaspora globosa]|uniref:cystathionine gamma-synthase n=1 Tax=Torulaspora globosa TaxID=48254 RepID=A0A7G3ZG13_9SACH|nr:uncharacterized protein HG536_0C06180 [Torulaspora globosa]QLL32449.1 hypothetical protein HG536_0C06180 [Torulaspora globosa]